MHLTATKSNARSTYGPQRAIFMPGPGLPNKTRSIGRVGIPLNTHRMPIATKLSFRQPSSAKSLEVYTNSVRKMNQNAFDLSSLKMGDLACRLGHEKIGLEDELRELAIVDRDHKPVLYGATDNLETFSYDSDTGEFKIGLIVVATPKPQLSYLLKGFVPTDQSTAVLSVRYVEAVDIVFNKVERQQHIECPLTIRSKARKALRDTERQVTTPVMDRGRLAPLTRCEFFNRCKDLGLFEGEHKLYPHVIAWVMEEVINHSAGTIRKLGMNTNMLSNWELGHRSEDDALHGESDSDLTEELRSEDRFLD